MIKCIIIIFNNNKKLLITTIIYWTTTMFQAFMLSALYALMYLFLIIYNMVGI